MNSAVAIVALSFLPSVYACSVDLVVHGKFDSHRAGLVGRGPHVWIVERSAIRKITKQDGAVSLQMLPELPHSDFTGATALTSTLIVQSNFKFYRSVDASHWEPIPLPFSPEGIRQGRIGNLLISPDGKSIWVAGGVYVKNREGPNWATRELGTTLQGSIFKSSDRGKRWTRNVTPFDEAYVLDFPSQPLPPTVVLGDYSVYFFDPKSGWSPAKTNLFFFEDREPSRIVAYDYLPDGTMFLSMQDGQLLRSKDRGRSWRRIFSNTSSTDPDPSFHGLAFANPLLGCAVDFSRKLLTTSNGGKTWKNFPAIPRTLDCAVADRSSFWVLTETNLQRITCQDKKRK